jgi:hypothetical protein
VCASSLTHRRPCRRRHHLPARPRLRGSRSRGWTLYRVLLAVLTAQALKMSAYLAYADSFRRGDAPVTTSRLFLAYIPFREAAQAAFLGLLLLLASGFSITRADMGAHKAKVVGIPAILLVTGVVTGVLYTQVRRGRPRRGVWVPSGPPAELY